MKAFLILFIFIIFSSCSTSNKSVYWCGDHPCVSKKEKHAYFKKTMIIEKRMIDMKDKKKLNEIEKITDQAKINEKSRINTEKNVLKEAKLAEKRRIQSEKKLLKQAKKDEMKRLKEEKILEKKIKKSEKKAKNKKKTIDNNIVNKNDKKIIESNNPKNKIKTNVNSASFDSLFQKILKKNSTKPYPDINDIPG
jgi:hypothetical protein